MIANKKNVDVFIFTNNFPFKPGENFLDLEITHLSKCFNTITLFPFKKSERLYKIPENASYTDDLINANPFLLLLAFIKMFFSRLFYKELLLLRRKYFLTNLYKSIVFFTKAIFIKERLKKIIVSRSVSLDSTLFYTYWCTSASLGLCLLKNEFPNIKVVSRIHGYDLYDYQHKTNYIPFQKATLEMIDRLYCVSYDGYEHLTDKFYMDIPGLRKKLFVIKLGTITNNS